MSSDHTSSSAPEGGATPFPKMDDVSAAIVEALRGAGSILTSMFADSYEISRKHDGSLVTEADLAADKFIAGLLSKRFPDIAIDSEEGRLPDPALAKSDTRWIVDPLDGTENYATLNPYFAVAIGLMSNEKVLSGGILQPFSQILCSFETGRVALWNGRPFAKTEAAASMRLSRVAFIPTRISSQSEFARDAHATIYRSCRRLVDNWAPSLDWCGLAAGRIDAVVSYREAGSFQEFDALIGKALFQQVWKQDAHIEQQPVGVDDPPNVLEIASTNTKLIREIWARLLGE